jgi:hypothetical protein
MVTMEPRPNDPELQRHAPRALMRFVQLLLIVVVFAVIGPLVGTIVVAAWFGLIGGTLHWIAQIPGIIIFGVVTGAAHMLGGIPAVVAGILIGIKQGWFGGVGWLFALGAGALVGMGTEVVLLVLSGPSGNSGLDGMFFAAATVSTLACWRIVKAWSYVREAHP